MRYGYGILFKTFSFKHVTSFLIKVLYMNMPYMNIKYTEPNI